MKTNRRMQAASLLAVAALGLSACGTVEDLTGGSDETSQNDENRNDENQDDQGDENQDDQDQGDENQDDQDQGDENQDDQDQGDENQDDQDQGDDNQDDQDQDDQGNDDNQDDQDQDDQDQDDQGDDGDEDTDNGAFESLTSPGTQLKVGETATIPQGDEGGTITLTVSKITKGSFDDISHLKDADEYKDYTPVYVEYTMTGTDKSDLLEYHILEDIRPVLTDGRRAGSLVIMGTTPFDKCDTNSIPKGFGPGQTETDCDIAMLADGQEIGGVTFEPYEGEYKDTGRIQWSQ